MKTLPFCNVSPEMIEVILESAILFSYQHNTDSIMLVLQVI